MMSDMHSTFDRVKLTLDRLNNLWSPSGNTFSHRAQYHLNNAVWNPVDPDHSIAQLIRADEQILAQYYIWNETCRDHALDSWNAIWGSCRDMLETLKYSMNRKSRSALNI